MLEGERRGVIWSAYSVAGPARAGSARRSRNTEIGSVRRPSEHLMLVAGVDLSSPLRAAVRQVVAAVSGQLALEPKASHAAYPPVHDGLASVIVSADSPR